MIHTEGFLLGVDVARVRAVLNVRCCFFRDLEHLTCKRRSIRFLVANIFQPDNNQNQNCT